MSRTAVDLRKKTAACSRRGFAIMAASTVALSPAAAWAADDGVREIRMRLASPPGGGRTVAVTLDACPGAFDARLAQVLVDHAIPATIFLTASWMRRNPDGLEFLKSHPDLFGLENHGWRHVPPVIGRRLFGLLGAPDLGAVREEVERGSKAILAATGRTPLWYRGATGFYSVETLPVIRATGEWIAGYSLNADQGASLPASKVAARIANARNGDVIVAHVNQPKRPSGAGVAAGLAALKENGVRFVRLADLGAGDVHYG